MAAEAKVQQALRLLEEVGRLDLVRLEAAPAARPARRAVSGVAADVLACSPLRRVTAVKKEGDEAGQQDLGRAGAVRRPRDEVKAGTERLAG
ncbi:hypothetical protein NDU88_002913 [Pleurodeles waltl]|uniref:Uncharacterized protein n=1 Tax=Pleurodeles waltl TaxID=8319 RepID=A0AAV7W3R6_PLEWA|nr:hypothetical protein NDU88_002913 [Pleurodeles waltl]